MKSLIGIMRNILIIFLLFALSFTLKAQQYTISNKKENTLYLGIDNPLGIIVENMKCGSFIITTDNGTIVDKGCCNYIIDPNHIGKARIEVKRVKRNDTINIGASVFNVKLIPKPKVIIGGLSPGKIMKEKLVTLSGITAYYEGFDFDHGIFITSYRVIIVKDKDTILLRDIKGNKITEELRTLFSQMKSNDCVYFIDIIAKCTTDRIEELNPIKFVIE